MPCGLAATLCERVVAAYQARAPGGLASVAECLHVASAFQAVEASARVCLHSGAGLAEARSVAAAAAALLQPGAELVQAAAAGRGAADSRIWACLTAPSLAQSQLDCVLQSGHALSVAALHSSDTAAVHEAASGLDGAAGWVPWLAAMSTAALQEDTGEASTGDIAAGGQPVPLPPVPLVFPVAAADVPAYPHLPGHSNVLQCAACT